MEYVENKNNLTDATSANNPAEEQNNQVLPFAGGSNFLTEMFAGVENGFIAATRIKRGEPTPETPKPKGSPLSTYIFLEDDDAIAKVYAESRNWNGQGYDVYYSTCPAGISRNETQRIRQTDVICVPFFFVDIDTQLDPEKAGHDVPVDIEEATLYLSMLKNPPTHIICSGHGVHAYWKLGVPITIKSPEDLDKVKQMMKNLARNVEREMGYSDFDTSASEPARIMRIDGTFNYKEGKDAPLEVYQMSSGTKRSYDLAELEEYFVDLPEKDKKPKAKSEEKTKEKIASTQVSAVAMNTVSERASPAVRELINRAMAAADGEKFRRLFNGDITGYQSDSSVADLALCGMLAFWARKDRRLMDEVFRQSRLMRDKWDERHGQETYGEMTIRKAIDSCDTVYDQNYGIESGYNPVIHQAKEMPIAKPNSLVTISGKVLSEKEFTPLRQPVEGLIVEGLTFLVGPSKIGKSWMSLLMAKNVAAGIPLWGRETTPCRVLYLALEDNERRLKSRLEQLGVTDIPDNLEFAVNAEVLGQGFEVQLREWLSSSPDPAMIIIDTFQKIRGLPRTGGNAYQADYEVVSLLKRIADDFRAAIVCIHHTNKLQKVDDPYDKVSGSTGIMGSADTTIMVDGERETNIANIAYTGRDVYGEDFVIRKNDCIWELVSNDAANYKAKTEYSHNPLVWFIHDLMEAKPDGGNWTYEEVKEKATISYGKQLFADSHDFRRKYDDRLIEDLRRYDGIILELGVAHNKGRGIRLSREINTVKREGA